MMDTGLIQTYSRRLAVLSSAAAVADEAEPSGTGPASIEMNALYHMYREIIIRLAVQPEADRMSVMRAARKLFEAVIYEQKRFTAAGLEELPMITSFEVYETPPSRVGLLASMITTRLNIGRNRVIKLAHTVDFDTDQNQIDDSADLRW